MAPARFVLAPTAFGRRPHAFAVGKAAAVAATFCVVACAGVRPVWAAESQGKITVDATATALVRPDIAEVRAAVTGSATLAADAAKKFRDNRRRAVDSLHKLALKGLAVEGRGPFFVSNFANNQQNAVFMWNNVVIGANQQTSTINCCELLVVRFAPIDHMKDEEIINSVVKILDVCKDAGLSNPTVQFRSTRLEATKVSAVKAAVGAARQKAELLAGFSRARVGAILSIQETTPAAANENAQQQGTDTDENVNVNGANVQTISGTPLSSLVVRAAVNVEFALERGH